MEQRKTLFLHCNIIFLLCCLPQYDKVSCSSDEAVQPHLPDADGPSSNEDFSSSSDDELKTDFQLPQSRHKEEHAARRRRKKLTQQKHELKQTIKFFKAISAFLNKKLTKSTTTESSLNETMCSAYLHLKKINQKFLSKYDTGFLFARIKDLFKVIGHTVDSIEEINLEDEINLKIISASPCSTEMVMAYQEKLIKQQEKLEKRLAQLLEP